MQINDNTRTTPGRFLIHKKLFPMLIAETPEEGKVLSIGTDTSWDYKSAFFNPMKLFDFETLDIDANLPADYHCSMEDCPIIPDDEFDLILFIGMYEFMGDPKKAFAEMYRILKPDRLALLSISMIGYGGGGHGAESLEQVLEEIKPLVAREIHPVYEGNGDISSIQIIAKKV